MVALRKESVDRNKNTPQNKLANMRSLSARRAWIEICTAETAITLIGKSLSARRAWIEMGMVNSMLTLIQSLSARRAWIEISIRKSTPAKPFVALRKESVDRNNG